MLTVDATGLCECGCGRPTKPAGYTSRTRGWIAGRPTRFINGHSGHKRNPAPGYAVDKETGCWNYSGYLRPDGYNGAVNLDGRRVNAHVAYYVRAKGPIPPGFVLDHVCSNVRCVNPDHLEPVTQAQNVRRSAARRAERMARETAAKNEIEAVITSALSEIRRIAAAYKLPAILHENEFVFRAVLKTIVLCSLARVEREATAPVSDEAVEEVA